MEDEKKVRRGTGVKFKEKYGCTSANIYKGNTDALRIPPKGHTLYDATSPTTFDEQRVRVIDAVGEMKDAIEVWTDPDDGILWILDGRSRHLDVIEVNRRRTARGCKMVEPYIVPFDGTEEEAIARVRQKNYHRRVPTPSDMAVDLRVLKKAGYGYAACADILHVTTSDAEQWGRNLLPLAFCTEEVRAAVDSGEIPKSAAKKFAGKAPDGSEKLGDKAQVALLTEMLAARAAPKAERRPRPSKRHFDDVVAAISEISPTIKALFAWGRGDVGALDGEPTLAKVVDAAMPKMGRPAQEGAKNGAKNGASVPKKLRQKKVGERAEA